MGVSLRGRITRSPLGARFSDPFIPVLQNIENGSYAKRKGTDRPLLPYCPYARITSVARRCLRKMGVLLLMVSACEKDSSLLGQWSTSTDNYHTIVDPNASPSHPLDPLTTNEIKSAILLLEDQLLLSIDRALVSVSLREPAKEIFRKPQSSARKQRMAQATILDLTKNETIEAIADLTAGRIHDWRIVDEGQAPISAIDVRAAHAALAQSQLWTDALNKRGIEPQDVFPAVLAWGSATPDRVRRLRIVPFFRGARTSQFAQPIEGLSAVVNANAGKVERVLDLGPVSMAPPTDLLDVLPRPGTPRKRRGLEHSEATVVSVDGRQVSWGPWRFRFAVLPREGLVIYDVAIMDSGRIRPIVHRASLSEMFVPYAAADSSWYFRAALDVGEYMLGTSVQPLIPSVDVPENALFADVVQARGRTPMRLRYGTALFERDGDILWRHADQGARARQLVLRAVFTVGNYDYCVFWSIPATHSD